jgi:YVTN family beta-propeller protein
VAALQVGHYRIDSLLGSGGMGEVYKAYDTNRDRYVALKLLPRDLSGDEEYLRRFKRESYAAARLREPHVVPVYDYGEIDGQLFIVMSLVEGTDIGALLHKDGRISPRRAVDLVSQVAEALDAAHADHLVHRDIKPSNILVTPDDFVYLVDFGIARSVGDRQAAPAVTGAATGALDYIAPERFADEAADARSDVYALACVLYECLTSRPPFTGQDAPALIYAHLYTSPPKASAVVEDVPPALDEVIARGMAKNPAGRFPTAGLLAEAAREALLNPVPVNPVPVNPVPMNPVPAPPETESRAPSWNQAPTQLWGAAVAPWQDVEEPHGEPVPDPAPEPEPAANPLIMPIYDSATQSMGLVGDDSWPDPGPIDEDEGWRDAGPIEDDGWRGTGPIDDGGWRGSGPIEDDSWRRTGPLVSARPGTSPGAGGGYLPPEDEEEDKPARGPSRRLGVLIVFAAAAVGVAVALILATAKPHAATPPKASAAGTASSTPAATASAAPSLAAPTVAEKIAVGGTPSYVQVAPDGQFAYVVNPGARDITVLNTADDQVSGTVKIPQGPPQFVSFSPDSQTAYVSVYSTGKNAVHLVAFIDTATGTVTSTVPVNNFTPGPSATSPDGRYLYVPNHNMEMTGTSLNVIDVIDTTTKQLVGNIAVQPNPHWIVFGKNNGLFYATDHMSTVITVLSANTNRVVKTIEVGETPHSIAISPDGSRLAITSFSGNEVFVVNTATDAEVATIPVGRNPLEITYSPDGRYIYTADYEDNTITVIDAADNQVIAEVPAGKAPASISVLPNGHQAYVSDEGDGTLEVLNLPQ